MTAHPYSGRLLAVLAAGVLAVSACGGGDTDASQTTTTTGAQGTAPVGAAAGDAVDIKDFKFEPVSLTTTVGTTVTFTNDDAQAHTATADDRSFNSDSIAAGANAPITFDTAGTFTYFCSFHPFMKGTVVVQ
ncbi:MAG: cupredoxin domain-containing protein [Acidimicrobiia bacterium]